MLAKASGIKRLFKQRILSEQRQQQIHILLALSVHHVAVLQARRKYMVL